MNFITNFSKNYFNNYYNEIFTYFLNNIDNENILIVNINQFNPLINFSHYLKKFNIHLYIVYHQLLASTNINEEIKNEECKKFIHNEIISINEIIDNYEKIKFDKIILFHIRSLEYLKKNLDIYSVFKSTIHIYISLCKKKTVFIKNIYREALKKIDSNETGYVFDFDSVINIINDSDNYEISSIQLIKNKNYALYGNNQSYQIILNNLNLDNNNKST